MKNLIKILTLIGLFAASASAQFVNFADNGSPANLSAFFYLGGDTGTNYVVAPSGAVGALDNDNQIMFSGYVPVAPPASPTSVPFAFWIHDDGYVTANFLNHQAQFSMQNVSDDPLPVAANSVLFGVSGLFAADSGLVLTPTFNFVSGDTDLTSNFSSNYDAGTGTFTFFNTGAFSVPNGMNLTFTGTFTTSAVPEPSTYAAIAGALALGWVAWRRRQRV